MTSDYREIRTTKEEFDKLRSDRQFAKLLNLARVVNAIYFCFHTLLEYGGDSTPVGQRQHINAFLFSTGALIHLGICQIVVGAGLCETHQVLDLQVVIKFGFLVLWQAFSFLPKNQVCYASFDFLGGTESNHVLRAGGRNKLDHFVVDFVGLLVLSPSRSLAPVRAQCTSSGIVTVSPVSALKVSKAAAARFDVSIFALT